MASLRFQIAPDVEFRMDMELEGVIAGSRGVDMIMSFPASIAIRVASSSVGAIPCFV